jgi:2'-hydroxyisoflavone reductase
MRLLVLGGTRFLGWAVVDAALKAGWEVTTLTRGESGQPPPAVDSRIGDRTTPEGLAALNGGEWDVCVDTSGFVPRDVLASARALDGRVGHYVFVSTINVHPDWPTKQVRDDSPRWECAPDAGPDDGDYGTLKSGCERAVEQVFGDASTLVRAGLLVGPQDNTHRLSWWLARLARGGEVLAGGSPDLATQLIDVRDLADWMLHCGQHKISGGFLATAPPGSSTFGRMLSAGRDVTGAGATLTWVDDQYLLDADVEPWTELPLWSPMVPADAERHVWDADSAPARDAGLVCRPIEETVTDTWAWLREAGAAATVNERAGRGIDPAKEQAILASWHRR